MADHGSPFALLRACGAVPPVEDLAGVPGEASAVGITRHTSNLSRLSELVHLRILHAHDISDAELEAISGADQVTHLSANIFGVRTLEPLRRMCALKVLELSDNTKLDSLEALHGLRSLQALALVNCPIDVDLGPLSACASLEFLWLSSRYSKPMRVDSLLPLAGLSRMKILKLKNVRVRDRSLAPLRGLVNLAEVELPDFFPEREFVALREALPHAHGHWLDIHAKRARA